MCKKIHRGGNAEQYHANKKYKEAVAVAVEARVGVLEDVLGPAGDGLGSWLGDDAACERFT